MKDIICEKYDHMYRWHHILTVISSMYKQQTLIFQWLDMIQDIRVAIEFNTIVIRGHSEHSFNVTSI